MNTNLLNQSGRAVELFIKSIPAPEFYSTILTRTRIATIYDKYAVNTLPATPEQILRGIMIQAFRFINMSIQDVTVLLVYGLNGLSREDLNLTDAHLAKKLAQQNVDKNDIDVINRIIGQVMTKLPADLRERMPGQTRIAMIQKLHSDLGIMFNAQRPLNQLSPASAMEPRNALHEALHEGFRAGIDENFQDRLTLNNTPKPTSLTNNFLSEVDDVKEALGEKTVKELQSQGYTPEILTRTSIDMRIGAGDYEKQLKDIQPGSGTVTGDVIKENVIPAEFYQKDPQLQMDAKTKELYYFDEYSGALIPINQVQRLKGEEITTEKQLNTVLKEYNLDRRETDQLLDDLQGRDVTTEEESSVRVLDNNVRNNTVLTSPHTKTQKKNVKPTTEPGSDIVISEEGECTIL